MSKKKTDEPDVKHPVEFESQAVVQSHIVRFFSRDGTGACTRDLTARFDYTNNGWVMSFYTKNLTWGPLQRSYQQTEFSDKNIDLYIKAFQYFDSIKDKLVDEVRATISKNNQDRYSPSDIN